jgi:hypothetical protein
VHENTVIVFSKATLLILQGCTVLTGYFFCFIYFLGYIVLCRLSLIDCFKFHYTI